MRLFLRLSAPYLAIGVFWCIFANAWMAILAYHAQILVWSGGSLARLQRPRPARTVLLGLPSLLVGPLLYALLPHMTRGDLSHWLANHHLSGTLLVVMIPYYGIIHPIFEQIHWAPLREKTPLAHLAFAGYHVLVLYSLLTPPWLILCFGVLATASFVWQRMTARTTSLAVPIVSHVLADLGVVVVARLRA